MPRFESHFNHCEKHTDRSQKSLGALPALFVPLQAVLQIGDAPAVPIAHQPVHLRLQYAQIAENLASNSFIIRIGWTPSTYRSHQRVTAYDPSGRLMNNAVENSE